MMRIEQPGTLMPGDGFCNCFILIRTLMFAATHTISPSIFFGTTQASIPGEFYPKSLIIMLIFLMYILISLLIVNRFRLVCCFTYIKKVFLCPLGSAAGTVCSFLDGDQPQTWFAIGLYSWDHLDSSYCGLFPRSLNSEILIHI